MKAELIGINVMNRCYTFILNNSNERVYIAFGKDDPSPKIGESYEIESYEGTKWSSTIPIQTLWRFKNENS